MAVDTSNVVSITVTTTTRAVAARSFSQFLIAGYHTKFAERTRVYAEAADMLDDGFTEADPLYLAALAHEAQQPHPTNFRVGRCATAFTKVFTMTPTAHDSTLYTLLVNDTEATFTSGVSATVKQIVEGLKAAIDLLAISGLTVTENDAVLTLTGSSGTYFTLEATDGESLMAIEETSADPSYATDLAAINQENSTWYGLVLPQVRSKAAIVAAATWVESNKKIFNASCQNTDQTTVVTTDVGSTLKLASRRRTAVWYHHAPHQMLDVAITSLCFALPAGRSPGSVVYAFKTVSGPLPSDNLTATQVTNLNSKNINYYASIGGDVSTFNGMVALGEYIDVVVGIDWLETRLQERLFAAIKNQPKKLPFTNAGLGVLDGQIRAQMDEAVTDDFLSADEPYTVTTPLVTDISSTDRATRRATGFKFYGTLAGAIYFVGVEGTVTAG